jgi:hypothetical protein
MQKVTVSFDTWIQLFGMIGLLGGLMFVGLEMQQSQRIAIAGQVQARNDSLMSYIMAPLEGNSVALQFFDLNQVSEGNAVIDFSNEEERLVYDQIIRFRVVSLQNAWQQYNLEMIPEDTFKYTSDLIMSMYNNCYLRNLIQGRASKGFLSYLETNKTIECLG